MKVTVVLAFLENRDAFREIRDSGDNVHQEQGCVEARLLYVATSSALREMWLKSMRARINLGGIMALFPLGKFSWQRDAIRTILTI